MVCASGTIAVALLSPPVEVRTVELHMQLHPPSQLLSRFSTSRLGSAATVRRQTILPSERQEFCSPRSRGPLATRERICRRTPASKQRTLNLRVKSKEVSRRSRKAFIILFI
jgi:hypothetical protein